MTISFEVMMRELSTQLLEMNDVEFFFEIDYMPQFDLKALIIKLKKDDFKTVDDFMNKINILLDKYIRKSNGHRKKEFEAMKVILLHACGEMRFHEDRIKSEIENRKLAATVDDQADDFSRGL